MLIQDLDNMASGLAMVLLFLSVINVLIVVLIFFMFLMMKNVVYIAVKF